MEDASYMSGSIMTCSVRQMALLVRDQWVMLPSESGSGGMRRVAELRWCASRKDVGNGWAGLDTGRSMRKRSIRARIPTSYGKAEGTVKGSTPSAPRRLSRGKPGTRLSVDRTLGLNRPVAATSILDRTPCIPLLHSSTARIRTGLRDLTMRRERCAFSAIPIRTPSGLAGRFPGQHGFELKRLFLVLLIFVVCSAKISTAPTRPIEVGGSLSYLTVYACEQFRGGGVLGSGGLRWCPVVPTVPHGSQPRGAWRDASYRHESSEGGA